MSIEPRAVEQRLIDAFRTADRVEPSDDLWTRVVHSIDEDRAHRRRVVWATVGCIGMLATLAIAAVPFRRDGTRGWYIEPLAFEAIAAVALTSLAIALGPAIRRFGRNYTTDLWPASPPMAAGLLRLLDLAYYLVLAGYILVTSRLDQIARPLPESSREYVADQISSASLRIGGLLLLIGTLHALTMLALPFVALVDNSTRRGRKLPKWLAIAGSVLLAWLALQLVGLAVLGLIAGAG